MLTASSIQQTALHARIPPGRGIPRILSRGDRLHIVLAVQPEPLNDLNGVLLVGPKVRKASGPVALRSVPIPDDLYISSQMHSIWDILE